MENETYLNYLNDFLFLLKEKAINSKLNKDQKVKNGDLDYQCGHLTAYYEVISLAKQQADAFNIDQSEIGIDDINPDIDLI